MHIHENKKIFLNRASRAVGHLQFIKTMIEEDRDCSEILIQLAAIKGEINSLSKVILKNHINECIVEAVKNSDNEVINRLNDAVDKIL